MEFQYWQPAVLVVLGALVVWGLVVSRRKTLLGLAIALVTISGFLLYTLVLEESYLEQDTNAQLETVALVGIPAVLGVVFGVFSVRRTGDRI
ncbi:hypothetical protein DMB66_46255 [Actinoplanes sp. ATCC 53533]|uniref:hypothetical protein n=1 Tax=Actinoplanes sp. ATCC 53533 TaxID=1288362 RepID=UPI000F7AE7B3|nr:hypothetical protein [Actinoplanes sp. ATCC 53533]RSM48490.1 hypothetical protein DMB66_46255 [Actinoplanes sp. ATCC 53533]